MQLAVGRSMMKKLAAWFLGDLPSDYPKSRLRGPQGRKNLRRLLQEETLRETVGGRHVPGHPSGVIVRMVRRGVHCSIMPDYSFG